MADLNAKQDGNQTFSVYGISGTLGDTYGTAETRPFTVTEDGKVRVDAELSVGTVSSGVQYTEGNTDNSITGNALMFEINTSDSSIGVVNADTPLPVYLNSSTGNPVGVTGGGLKVTVQGTAGDSIIDETNTALRVISPLGTTDLDLGTATIGKESAGVLLAGFGQTSVLADHSAYGDDMATNIAAVGVRLFDGTDYDRWRGDATNGADVDVTRLPNIPGGTVQLNPRLSRNLITYGTTSSGTIGTIVAAPGSGTSIYVESLDISVQSGTVEPCVSFGLVSSGQGVLGRGMYAATGGIQKTFSHGVNGGTTNAALTWNVLTSSGTVSYNVVYWVE